MTHRKRKILFSLIVIGLFQVLFIVITLQFKESWVSIVYNSMSNSTLVQRFQSFPNETESVEFVRDQFAFANASYSSSNKFIRANSMNNADALPMCDSSIIDLNDSTSYRVNVNFDVLPFDVIERRLDGKVLPGGHWFPRHCQSRQRLAIFICYRNRPAHLKVLLNHIHDFLQRQQLDYTIIVVNQHGEQQFNRAALFDVGYLEAKKFDDFDCLIFHDVDLLPEDLRNFYTCGERPRHMSVAVDKFNYRLLYAGLFGGVTAFQVSDFIAVNGYPTVYWGWGGEDDDMFLRVTRYLNKSITRYPLDIARYKMVRSFNHVSGRANPNRRTILESRYKYNQDGLNTIRYQVHRIVFYRLFTLINVTLIEETFEQIRLRLNITRILPTKVRKKIQTRKKGTNVSFY